MRGAMKLMKPGILLKDFNLEVGAFWEEEQWHVPLKDADIVILDNYTKDTIVSST